MAPADAHTPADRRVAGTARLLRGWAGALVMTLLAALFHAAAAPGHAAPGLPVLAASVVLAAPACTALAGRLGSLWRTAGAVVAAQGLFHALYALAGHGHPVAVTAGAGAHAGHPALVPGPLLVPTGGAGAAAPLAEAGELRMLAAHLLAAVVTLALLRRGEALVLAIVERVVEAALILWTRVLTPLVAAPAPPRGAVGTPPGLRPSLLTLSTPGLRGPPSYVLAA